MSSTYKWLGDPVSFGITDPEQIAACRKLDIALRDYVNRDRWDEPCFEDDHFGEVGHAYQEHVSASLNSNLLYMIGETDEKYLGHGRWILAFCL